MADLYKGYIKTKNKQAAERFKDRTDFKTLDEVSSLPEYAGILEKDIMFFLLNGQHLYAIYILDNIENNNPQKSLSM